MVSKQTLRAHHTPNKRLRNNICSFGRSMRMVIRIEAIHLRGTQLLKFIRHKLSMIHEFGVIESLRAGIGVGRESIRCVLESTSFPRVVRSRRADDHAGPEAGELLRGFDEVGWVGQDVGLLRCVTCLVTGAWAVGSTVVFSLA
jgi:hypothetical protein